MADTQAQWVSNKPSEAQPQELLKKSQARVEEEELNQSIRRSSEDVRKKGALSNSKQAHFNDWIQKSIETYNPKARDVDEILNESSVNDSEPPQQILWPSAAEKREEPSKIQWLSKTKEQKEREIERELDGEDDFEDDYVRPRKQPSDDRSFNTKFGDDARLGKGTLDGPKQQAVNIDDIPIPTANAAKPKSFNDLLQEKLMLHD